MAPENRNRRERLPLDSSDSLETETHRVEGLQQSTVGSTGDDQFPQLPTEFGRYRVERLLGHGGMGAVYLAHDSQLDRRVALKIPRGFEDATDQRKAADRFMQEARSAASVHHPNVCAIHDVGELNGRLFLSMAFVEGESLADRLKRVKKLDSAEALELVRTIALALAEAHRQGVVHRDLKPANIMLNSVGEPIVTDFGLAYRQHAEDPKLTKSGMVMGTPAYMAPEQIEADQNKIGPATDLYSLGVIFFELLTGRTPFAGSGLAVLGRALTEPATFPDDASDLSPQLKAVCLRALAKDPAERYSSADEFIAALEAAAVAPTRSGKRFHSDAPSPAQARVWSIGVLCGLALVVGGVVWMRVGVDDQPRLANSTESTVGKPARATASPVASPSTKESVEVLDGAKPPGEKNFASKKEVEQPTTDGNPRTAQRLATTTPSKTEVIQVGLTGADSEELIAAIAVAGPGAVVEICTNEPFLLSGRQANRIGLSGTMTIRGGDGYQPIIARRGLEEGPLLAINGRRGGQTPPTLKLRGITFVDASPMDYPEEEEDAPFYRILIATGGVYIDADSCVFIEAYGGCDGNYAAPKNEPQMRFSNCVFYHLPLNRHRRFAFLSGRSANVYLENCLAVGGRLVGFTGSPDPALVGNCQLAVRRSTVVGCSYLAHTNNAMVSVLLDATVVSDGSGLFSVDSAMGYFSDRFQQVRLNAVSFRAMTNVLWPDTQALGDGSGLDDEAPAIAHLRSQLEGEQTNWSFEKPTALAEGTAQLSNQGVLSPRQFSFVAEPDLQSRGADLNKLPSLPPRLTDVLPEKYLVRPTP